MVGAPVKWVEDRRENLLAAGQVAPGARGREDGVRLPTARSRPPTSTSSRTAAPIPTPWPLFPAAAVGTFFPGPYRVPRAGFAVKTIYTNTVGRAPYRGPWQFESLAREVLLDIAARQMGIDPAELRRRNLLRRTSSRTRTPTA